MSATRLSFELPPELEARTPPELRGLTRDAVRLLVAARSGPELVHSTFALLPRFLRSGDLLVINTSATIPAAFDAVADDGSAVVVHLSTQLHDDLWAVEVRHPSSRRWLESPAPVLVTMGEAAFLRLLEPYRASSRLWVARLVLPEPTLSWLASYGRPIRYSYVHGTWPLSSYQTVYATEPGSAEMPSAGRPFTPEIVTRLVAMGVGVTPLVLHAGVASLESDELPYPERVHVPAVTAARVNATHRSGGRVIAVGTTVVRALEAAVDRAGQARAFDGWVDLVISPETGVRLVDGLITGWHEPEASHLLMLEAIAGRELLVRSYEAALQHGYLWHEFGDSHLILP